MMNTPTKLLFAAILTCLSASVLSDVIEIKGEKMTISFDKSISKNVDGYNVYIDGDRVNENGLIQSGYQINSSHFQDKTKIRTIYVTAQSSNGLESNPTGSLQFKFSESTHMVGMK